MLLAFAAVRFLFLNGDGGADVNVDVNASPVTLVQPNPFAA